LKPFPDQFEGWGHDFQILKIYFLIFRILSRLKNCLNLFAFWSRKGQRHVPWNYKYIIFVIKKLLLLFEVPLIGQIFAVFANFAKIREIKSSRNLLKIVPSRKLILAKFFVFDFFFLSKLNLHNKIRKKIR